MQVNFQSGLIYYAIRNVLLLQYVTYFNEVFLLFTFFLSREFLELQLCANTSTTDMNHKITPPS